MKIKKALVLFLAFAAALAVSSCHPSTPPPKPQPGPHFGSVSNQGRWNTFLDCDLTAESSQTLSTDTTYTICGITWTKVNSAFDSGSMAVTHGSGMIVTPSASSNWSPSGFQAPGAHFALSQLNILGLDWSTGIRIWAHVSASNAAANFDNAVVSLGNLVGGSPGLNWSWMVLRGYNSSNGIWSRRMAAGSNSDSPINVPTTIDNTHANVMILRVASLSNGNNNVYRLSTYSSGWPALTQSDQIIWHNESGFTFLSPNSAGTTNQGLDPSAFSVFLGALRGSSGTGLSVTYAHIRVDAKI